MDQTDEQRKVYSMWLQLDRSTGHICEFLGIAKADYGSDGQASLDKALAQADEAAAFLSSWIHKQCAATVEERLKKEE